MTAVHVHPHERTRGNPDIHIKQVRLFNSIATLVYHTQPERLHPLFFLILLKVIKVGQVHQVRAKYITRHSLILT